MICKSENNSGWISVKLTFLIGSYSTVWHATSTIWLYKKKKTTTTPNHTGFKTF